MNGLRILLLRGARLVRRAPARSLMTGFLVLAAVLVGSLWLSESRGHYEQNSSAESKLGQADARYDLLTSSLVPLFGNSLPTPTTGFDTGAFESETAALESDAWPMEDRLPIPAQVDAVLDALPEHSEVAMLESFENVAVGTAVVPGPVTVTQGPWGDPLLEGMVDLADGRLPGPGEVVVPPSLAVALGVEIGDRLFVRSPVAVLDVVGLGSTGSWPQLVVAEGEFVMSESVEPGSVPPLAYASVLAELPPGGTAPAEVHVGATPDDGHVAVRLDQDSFIGPPTGSSTGVVVLVTAFVGLSAGAAFGIGAARRRRALGLLATNGATQGQLRLAAGAEALVVSVPAAVVGSAAAAALPGVWLRLRLPGWDRLWQVAVPLSWMGLLTVAAVAAAVLGAIVFSRSVSSAAVPALLDARGATRRRTGGVRPWWGVWVFVAALIVVPLSLPVLALLSTRQTFARGWVVLAALVAWCAGVAVVVVLARRLLARHAVGRLVGRDLARRPVGAGAAVMVVAAWSFVAVSWTLNAGASFNDGLEEFGSAEPSTDTEAVDDAGIVTIRPPVAGAVRHRSSIADAEQPGALSNELQGTLAALGLKSERATVGNFTGPCPMCPEGFQPTVMVLESVDGLELPAQVTTALRAGSVVTPFGLDGLDGSTVGGMPVTVAALPIDVSAAMLREFAPEGETLDDPVEVLVGSTAELSDSAAASVVVELAGAGVEVSSDDLRLQPLASTDGYGSGRTGPTDRNVLWWTVSVFMLALVTLAATAAHRREHGEAAHVLWVLGAGPDAGRRLAALTAGSLAATGVLIGSTTAATLTAVTWLGNTGVILPDLLDPPRVLALFAVVVVVPSTAALLGRLLPPSRSVHTDVRPA